MNINTNALIALNAQAAETVVSSDMPSGDCAGVTVGVNLIGMTSATVTVHVQGKDALSGQYYDLLVSPEMTAVGFVPLTVYPGIEAGTTEAAAPLPATWRVMAFIAGASASVTGTVGASLTR